MLTTSNPQIAVKPVTTREELIYLLSRASELEHGLACVYLFAAYSLKTDISEGGLTAEQATMVRTWKRKLAGVAIEEMLHLAQVSNMLTAIGGAPHFKRNNFPMPPNAFPFGICLTLEPFCQQTIERFLCFEMPEAGVLSEEQRVEYEKIKQRVIASENGGSATPDESMPIGLPEEEYMKFIEPYEIDFKTVGEFYHKIKTGFEYIPEEELFIGPAEAQANARYVDFGGELIGIFGQKDAFAAIDMIIEQGEAPTFDHPDAHFNVFDSIRKEYEKEIKETNETGSIFEPARPVISNPMTRYYDDTSGGNVIKNSLTHEVADLFNMAYDTMLLMLLRFFAHNDETEEELEIISKATLRIMTTVIRPLGDALAKMPAGSTTFPGMNAGPGFGYNRDVHLLPHKRSAWIFLGERLGNLALRATALLDINNVPKEMNEAAASLEALARLFALTTGEWSKDAENAKFETLLQDKVVSIDPETNGPYLVRNVLNLVNSTDEPIKTTTEMALCRCGGSANKPFCNGTHARNGFSSEKKPNRVPDRQDNYINDQLIIHDNRGICQHSGFCTDELANVFHLQGDPFVYPEDAPVESTINQIKRCPSGALSYSYRGVEQPNDIRPPKITISKNGPYRITGGIQINTPDHAVGASREHYAICRCGGSKNKPFCDGSHWYNNFTDDKN